MSHADLGHVVKGEVNIKLAFRKAQLGTNSEM